MLKSPVVAGSRLLNGLPLKYFPWNCFPLNCFRWSVFALCVCAFAIGCNPTAPPLVIPDDASPTEQSESKTAKSVPTILFDGQTLDGWEVIGFGGEGDCRVENGSLVLEAGDPMTGVRSTRTDLPTTSYEISLEVQRIAGIDFFCGLTFPVADSHCCLIVGGWSGPVVGLSNIDDQDAAHNETRKLMKFEKNRWYNIKVRVQPTRIAAWIDDEPMVDQDITDRKISLRHETVVCRPLGICNFETTSEFRNIKLVELPPTP